MTEQRRVSILGTRGVPARHGGFETFVARLAPYLAECGWDVSIYCQVEQRGGGIGEDTWNGCRRWLVPTRARGTAATIEFDLRSTLHALGHADLKLVLGYNTAILNLLHRARKRRVVMNMDGIEWQRAKWNGFAQRWLRANEWIGARTAHRLVADHPEIERHLRRVAPAAHITMIPYGADEVSESSTDALDTLGLTPEGYVVMIARIEPENSVLEVVRAFARAPLGARLVVLGTFLPEANRYHAVVHQAASNECLFPGAIYDPAIVAALRYHALAYVHGHTVGGTNPSLVEALGAGTPVIAHDNRFNRWVAGDAAAYFSDEEACRQVLERFVRDPAVRAAGRRASRERHRQAFRWQQVREGYETLLRAALGPARDGPARDGPARDDPPRERRG